MISIDVSDTSNSFDVLACTGWPTEPHTVMKAYMEDGLLHIRTNKGYGYAEGYFKVIKELDNEKQKS